MVLINILEYANATIGDFNRYSISEKSYNTFAPSTVGTFVVMLSFQLQKELLCFCGHAAFQMMRLDGPQAS